MAGADIQRNFGGLISTSLIMLCVRQIMQLDLLGVITPDRPPLSLAAKASSTTNKITARGNCASRRQCIVRLLHRWAPAATEMIIAN